MVSEQLINFNAGEKIRLVAAAVEMGDNRVDRNQKSVAGWCRRHGRCQQQSRSEALPPPITGIYGKCRMTKPEIRDFPYLLANNIRLVGPGHLVYLSSREKSDVWVYLSDLVSNFPRYQKGKENYLPCFTVFAVRVQVLPHLPLTHNDTYHR
jgi:hypothetical protein